MTPHLPPAVVEWPADLLREHAIVVSRGQIIVRGRQHVAGRFARIDAETKEPRAGPSVVLLCLGAMVLPFTVGVTPGWQIGIPVGLMLLSGARLLTVETRYRVVLREAGRATVLFETADHRCAVALTAALQAALDEPAA